MVGKILIILPPNCQIDQIDCLLQIAEFSPTICDELKLDHYKKIIYDRMIIQIEADLTIGRNDSEITPFTPAQISEFITINKKLIDQAVDKMLFDLSRDDELDSLLVAYDDWFREYLYETLGVDHMFNETI